MPAHCWPGTLSFDPTSRRTSDTQRRLWKLRAPDDATILTPEDSGQPGPWKYPERNTTSREFGQPRCLFPAKHSVDLISRFIWLRVDDP